MEDDNFLGSRIIRDLDAFKAETDLIVVKRLTDEVVDVTNKIFTRDLFGAS